MINTQMDFDKDYYDRNRYEMAFQNWSRDHYRSFCIRVQGMIKDLNDHQEVCRALAELASNYDEDSPSCSLIEGLAWEYYVLQDVWALKRLEKIFDEDIYNKHLMRYE